MSCDRLDYEVQGRGHNRGSKFQGLFMWTTSFEPPNSFVTKLGVVVRWCEPECGGKRLCCYLRGEGEKIELLSSR